MQLGTYLDARRKADLALDPNHPPAPVAQIERRNCPATRADHIIATGEARRVSYRLLNPTADTAMLFGAQIGYLHGEIRRLDNELSAFCAVRDTNLGYAPVYCNELDCDVLVGYDYTPGEDSQTWGPPENCHEGSPEELTVYEVWLNGADIAAVLLERVAEQLTEAALAYERQARADALDDFRESQGSAE